MLPAEAKMLTYPVSEQIRTNRNSTITFGPKRRLRMRTIGIADGTTITGFYGHFVSLQARSIHLSDDTDSGETRGDKLINLGVISEHL